MRWSWSLRVVAASTPLIFLMGAWNLVLLARERQLVSLAAGVFCMAMCWRQYRCFLAIRTSERRIFVSNLEIEYMRKREAAKWN